LVLILLTAIAYANAWPDALVWDDTRFALSSRFSGIGLEGIGRFFTEDLWAIEGTHSGLYRPLLLLSIWLDAFLFGDWVAGYHLVNILLHVVATVMVYGLTRQLLQAGGDPIEWSGHIALLAALIFAVHPIHTEAVNSIFNRSEILVTIGIAGGLCWFLPVRERQPKKAWLGLSLIYLLVLLCRENGAVLPALTLIILWATVPGTWLLRLRKSLPVLLLLIPLAIYLALRANALAEPHPTQKEAVAVSEQAVEQPKSEEEAPASQGGTGKKTKKPAAQLTDSVRLIKSIRRQLTSQIRKLPQLVTDIQAYDTKRLRHAVRLWADAVKIVLWPSPLLLYHGKVETKFPAALALFVILLASGAAALYRKRPGLITGLAFFYIALMPSSGIIGAITNPTLAERFLYLPSAGIGIVLAFALKSLAQRFKPRSALVATVILAMILTPLTWARNTDWSSNTALMEADYSKGVRSIFVLQGLVEYSLGAGNYSRAVAICDLHKDFMGAYWFFGNLCGSAYERVGRYEEAEQALLHAIRIHPEASTVYINLAGMQLRRHRRDDAVKYFEQGITAENEPFLKEFLIGFMLTEIYPADRGKLLEARDHLKQSLQLQPQFFQARALLKQIDKTLTPTRE